MREFLLPEIDEIAREIAAAIVRRKHLETAGDRALEAAA